jgi:L-asparaginase
VINVSRIKNPIHLAQFLQQETDRILSGSGAIDLARELQIPPYDPLTDFRIQEWIEERRENFQNKNRMARLISQDPAESSARK